MARKRNRRNPRNKQEQKFRLEVNLPQNIHLVGEMDGNEEKRIYISQSVYQSIHRFTKNKTTKLKHLTRLLTALSRASVIAEDLS